MYKAITDYVFTHRIFELKFFNAVVFCSCHCRAKLQMVNLRFIFPESKLFGVSPGCYKNRFKHRIHKSLKYIKHLIKMVNPLHRASWISIKVGAGQTLFRGWNRLSKMIQAFEIAFLWKYEASGSFNTSDLFGNFDHVMHPVLVSVKKKLSKYIVKNEIFPFSLRKIVHYFIFLLIFCDFSVTTPWPRSPSCRLQWGSWLNGQIMTKRLNVCRPESRRERTTEQSSKAQVLNTHSRYMQIQLTH